jgi:phage repressor protein C with HTH and peptisase S24 domain
MQENSLIKQNILKYLEVKGITQYKFHKDTGITRGVLAQNNGISESNTLRFLDYYNEVSPEWLLTGKGSMLKEVPTVKAVASENGLPLLPYEAFAGIGDADVAGVDFRTIEERYVVPLFDGIQIDFMLSVRGSSMYPKYNSGDVVACRLVKDLLFIQWNKVYVLDTHTQGVVMKRLKKSEAQDHVICKSYNPSYDPFELPRSEIRNIALVVGVIRLE